VRGCVLKEFGSADNLVIDDVPEPVPGAGEVVLDVHAAGITYADLLIVEGKYQALPKLPFIPGQEVSGVIRSVGSGLTRLQPGMRVLGFAPVGAYAERVAVPEKDCHVLPSSMPFSDAAAMGIAYQTAHIALLDRGQLRRGEAVLINGAAGGVGLAAVQVAKAKGAVVLAGLTTLTKAEVVRASGADHVIDLTQRDLAKSLRDQVFAVTGGRGANVVIDLIGGDVFDASMRALAWRGRAVVIGFVSNRIPVIKTNYLLIKNVSASGLFWDSYRREASDEVREVQEDLFALYTAGKIKPVIVEALPLEQIGRAFGRISRREVVGRVLLDPTA